MLNINLNNCDSISDLNNFLSTLEKNGVKYDGRAFIHLSTKESINLKNIKNKILIICKKELQSSPPSLENAVRIHDLFSKFELITKELVPEEHRQTIFKNFGEFKEISQSYERRIRADAKVMRSVIGRFNSLVQEINEDQKRYQWTYLPQDLNQKLHQMQFLNRFLGMNLSKNQLLGREPLPQWGDLEIVALTPPPSLNPTECENLGMLYSLIRRISQESFTLKGEDLEISNGKTIALQDIEKQFQKLYVEEMKRESYSKIDCHLQATALLFSFFKLAPTRKSPHLQKIYEESGKAIRQDERMMTLIQKQYNQIAGSLNSMFRQQSYLNNHSTQRELGYLEFLNHFIQFPLTLVDLEGGTILPEIFDLEIQNERYGDEHYDDERFHARHCYNVYAWTLNYEYILRAKHTRLKNLELQLASDNVTSLFLSPEQSHRLEDELQELKFELEHQPELLKDSVFQSLQREVIRLASVLNISLSVEQKIGDQLLPIYGRELDLPSQCKPKSIALPYHAGEYNATAEWINAYRRQKAIENKIARHYFERVKMGTLETWMQSEKLGEELHALEKEREMLEEELKPKHLLGIHKLGERWYNHKLSNLLAWRTHMGLSSLIEITPEQIEGKELLPLCNLSEIPIPHPEKFCEEFMQVAVEKRRKLMESWPEHWLKNIENPKLWLKDIENPNLMAFFTKKPTTQTE